MIMRTFDFGEDLSISSDGKLIVNNRPRLCARIIAYLAWPECAERRDQHLATGAAKHMHHVFEGLDVVARDLPHGVHESNDGADYLCQDPQHLIAIKKMQILQENFAIFGGGFAPLAEAAFNEPLQDLLDSGMHHAALAGERLLLTARMAAYHAKDLRRGASLNKATDLLAWLRSKYQEPKSRNPIMEAWNGHKNVAHLAAAAVVIGAAILRSRPTANGTEVPTVTILTTLKHTEQFVQLSQDFLDFGLTFKSFGLTQTILDGETVWHLPVDLPSRPLERVVWPLSNEEFEYLHTKRWAPVPID